MKRGGRPAAAAADDAAPSRSAAAARPPRSVRGGGRADGGIHDSRRGPRHRPLGRVRHGERLPRPQGGADGLRLHSLRRPLHGSPARHPAPRHGSGEQRRADHRLDRRVPGRRRRLHHPGLDLHRRRPERLSHFSHRRHGRSAGHPDDDPPALRPDRRRARAAALPRGHGLRHRPHRGRPRPRGGAPGVSGARHRRRLSIRHARPAPVAGDAIRQLRRTAQALAGRRADAALSRRRLSHRRPHRGGDAERGPAGVGSPDPALRHERRNRLRPLARPVLQRARHGCPADLEHLRALRRRGSGGVRWRAVDRAHPAADAAVVSALDGRALAETRQRAARANRDRPLAPPGVGRNGGVDRRAVGRPGLRDEPSRGASRRRLHLLLRRRLGAHGGAHRNDLPARLRNDDHGAARHRVHPARVRLLGAPGNGGDVVRGGRGLRRHRGRGRHQPGPQVRRSGRGDAAARCKWAR